MDTELPCMRPHPAAVHPLQLGKFLNAVAIEAGVLFADVHIANYYAERNLGNGFRAKVWLKPKRAT
eukprot:4260333-Pleurochrysis_carterae.AAC.1